MLRHRKKHSGVQNINPMHFQNIKSPNGEPSANSGNMSVNQSASDMSDDEQVILNNNHEKLMKMMPDMIPINNFLSQINQHFINNHLNNDNNNNSNNNENQSNNIEEKSTPIAAAVLNAAILEKLTSLQQQFRESREGDGSLIGNLLGISDQGILNKVFMSSPDEVAKILGVDK